MAFVTDFADQAVLLPVAVAALAVFVSIGWWQAAFAWSLGVGGTFAAVLLLKIGFLVLASSFGSDYFLSPSGHTAASCAVYGGLAVVVGRGRLPLGLILLAAAVMTVAVGQSRIALGAHTGTEVLVGGGVGALGLLVMAMLVGPRPRRVAVPISATCGLLIVVLHGIHLDAERTIRSAATGW